MPARGTRGVRGCPTVVQSEGLLVIHSFKGESRGEYLIGATAYSGVSSLVLSIFVLGLP